MSRINLLPTPIPVKEKGGGEGLGRVSNHDTDLKVYQVTQWAVLNQRWPISEILSCPNLLTVISHWLEAAHKELF